MASRAYLAKITVTVVTGFATADSGDEPRLKDSIEVEKSVNRGAPAGAAGITVSCLCG